MPTKASRKRSPEDLRKYAKDHGLSIHFSTIKRKLPNNRGCYVYRVESFYDKKIHNSRQISQKLIGKLPPGETDICKMIPTDKKYVSKKVDAGKVMETAGIVTDNRRLACVQYPLDIVLLVIVLAGMAGYSSCYAIAQFWAAQKETLKKLIKDFPLQDISHDTVRRVIKLLGGKDSVDFVKRVTEPLVTELGHRLLAIDGQAVRAAGELGKASRYILNLFDCDEEICIRQIQIGAKENEITRAREIYSGLNLRGAIATCDALNTQKALAEFLIGEGADYCFALKENHKTLYDIVSIVFNSREGSEIALVHETSDRGHGREEKRTYRVLPASCFPELESSVTEWKGLEEGCIVETTTERKILKTGAVSKETRYFITSLAFDRQYIGKVVERAIRGHWGIENKLHWSLDLVFYQDRMQCKNADFINGKTSINKIVYNVMSRVQSLQEEETGRKAISKPAMKAMMSDPKQTIKFLIRVYHDGMDM